MNQFNHPYKLLTALIVLISLFWLQPNVATAQSAQGIQNRIENRAKLTAREGVNRLKGTARRKAYSSKRALKQSIRGAKAPRTLNTDPTLDELIEDREKKESIRDNTNKGRYVELFGEWTTMPNDAQLKARAEWEALKDSLNSIDDSYFRETKRIWDGTRPMVIFGWHPYWLGEMYKSYDYGLYNVVSFYSYDINPYTGAPQNPEAMRDLLSNEFVSNAQQNGCSALLSITCHGEQNVMRFLNQNAPARQLFMDSILYILDSTNMDGVEINFNGVNETSKNEFYKFVSILSSAVVGLRGDTSFIFMSVPPYDPDNVYDIARLQNYVDMFVVKGFDMQQTPEGLKKVPVAPLNYTRLSQVPDISTAVDKYIANIGPLYSDRIILALPYFGTLWYTDGVTEEIIDMQPITYSDVQFDFVSQIDNYNKFPGARLRYDSTRTTYEFRYLDYYDVDTSRGDIPNDVTLYFDDSLSLRKKYRYIVKNRLGGVGVEFLGSDAGFYHLEQLLSEEFMEIKRPVDNKLAQIHDESSYYRRNSIYFLVVLLYIGIFAAIGFCVALFHQKTRQALFQSGRFRLVYMLFFTTLILLLGAYMGLFQGTTLPLMIGITFGAFMSWAAWKFLSEKQSTTP